MSDAKLDGVLAIRQSWCRPGEPILVCAESSGASTRYDVVGLDQMGRPQGGVGRALSMFGGAVDVVDKMGGPRDTVRSTPYVVVFGERPDALAPRLSLPTGGDIGAGWWVLTPLRLARVTAAPVASEPEPAPEPGRSLLRQVRGLAKGVREAMADKSGYAPHRPVETLAMVTAVEAPRTSIAGITPVQRRLPEEFGGGRGAALRIGFVDGSGLDLVGGREPSHVERLLNMVHGQR